MEHVWLTREYDRKQYLTVNEALPEAHPIECRDSEKTLHHPTMIPETILQC